jgi:hypothetical protein
MSRHLLRALARLGAVCAGLTLGGCAVFMEADRPTPVDLSKLKAGEDRLDVVTEIGAPVASLINAGNACDVYKLYTRGPGAVGKGLIVAGETVADVMTLGLSEALFTPVAAATKADRHTVVICYSPGNKLVSLRESPNATN